MVSRARACCSIGILFVSLVAECLGGWSLMDIQTITNIGRLQGQNLGVSPQQHKATLLVTRHFPVDRECFITDHVVAITGSTLIR